MKLYINAFSPNVRRVRLTAAVLGLKLDEQNIDFTKGEHKTPEYLVLNPNGTVPVLVDEDFVLTESRAIMQYLAVKHPKNELLPLDERARADVTRWQFWDSSHFSPHLGAVAFQRVFKQMFGMGAPDTSKVEEGLTNFRRFAAVLNTQLDGKQFIVGNRLTLADLTLASSLMYAKQSEVPIAEFPRVEAWFASVTSLDAWKDTAP
ncbi:MAG TPA: glutathione S-transferase family protein [Polyangiaceae bacterium]|nr:glutathione S-transferase family protein [Polyangiaceae bacterium]